MFFFVCLFVVSVSYSEWLKTKPSVELQGLQAFKHFRTYFSIIHILYSILSYHVTVSQE